MAQEDLEYGVDVSEATHVKTSGGRIEKIISKYGLDEKGRPEPPSRGGFGVITESGRTVSMWNARAYLRERKK